MFLLDAPLSLAARIRITARPAKSEFSERSLISATETWTVSKRGVSCEPCTDNCCFNRLAGRRMSLISVPCVESFVFELYSFAPSLFLVRTLRRSTCLSRTVGLACFPRSTAFHLPACPQSRPVNHFCRGSSRCIRMGRDRECV